MTLMYSLLLLLYTLLCCFVLHSWIYAIQTHTVWWWVTSNSSQTCWQKGKKQASVTNRYRSLLSVTLLSVQQLHHATQSVYATHAVVLNACITSMLQQARPASHCYCTPQCSVILLTDMHTLLQRALFLAIHTMRIEDNSACTLMAARHTPKHTNECTSNNTPTGWPSAAYP
jgi:hypothetical protein